MPVRSDRDHEECEEVLQNRLLPQFTQWFSNMESYKFMQDGDP